MRAGANSLWMQVWDGASNRPVLQSRLMVPHLNGKMTFVEGFVYLRYSYRQMVHVVQEWDEVARVVLAIIRKSPWYHLFDA